MKENAISKINKMGQIGGIITIIAKVFIIIGLVGCLIAGIVFAVMPKDFLEVQLGGNAIVNVDWSAWNIKADSTDVEAAESQFEQIQHDGSTQLEGSMDFNGMEYKVNDMKMTENGVTVNASANNFTVSLHNVVWVMVMAFIKLAMTLVTLFFISSLCKSFKNCASPFEDGVIKKMQNLAISLIPWVILSSISDSIAQSVFTGKVNIVTSIDLTVVVIILLILALVYIFKYGAVLQQESDETL